MLQITDMQELKDITVQEVQYNANEECLEDPQWTKATRSNRLN